MANGSRPIAGYPSFDGSQPCRYPSPEEAAGFAGDRGADPLPALTTCSDEATGRACPFLQPCRAYALTHDVEGVWGGMTAEERRQVRAEVGLSDPVTVSRELDVLVRSWRARRPARRVAA